jgi:hypothetical protein
MILRQPDETTGSIGTDPRANGHEVEKRTPVPSAIRPQDARTIADKSLQMATYMKERVV